MFFVFPSFCHPFFTWHSFRTVTPRLWLTGQVSFSPWGILLPASTEEHGWKSSSGETEHIISLTCLAFADPTDIPGPRAAHGWQDIYPLIALSPAQTVVPFFGRSGALLLCMKDERLCLGSFYWKAELFKVSFELALNSCFYKLHNITYCNWNCCIRIYEYWAWSFPEPTFCRLIGHIVI